MHLRTKLAKWGNSLGLRISGPLRSIPHFTENMLVDIEINEDGLLIKPVVKRKQKKLKFKEAELLMGLNPKAVHSDDLARLMQKEYGDE